MQQYHVVVLGREDYPRDAIRQLGTDLPEIRIHFSHQRHSKRPAELYGFDVFADDLAIFFVERL